MIGLILIGLFALIFQKMVITNNLALRGKSARYFGLTLVLLSFPLDWGMDLFLETFNLSQFLEDAPYGGLFNMTVFCLVFIVVFIPFLKKQKKEIISKQSEVGSTPEAQPVTMQNDGARLFTIFCFLFFIAGMNDQIRIVNALTEGIANRSTYFYVISTINGILGLILLSVFFIQLKKLLKRFF